MATQYRGGKLDQDGNFTWFPGSTIICDLDDEAVLNFAKSVQRKVARSSFGGCYSMLPIPSMHCTIFDLANSAPDVVEGTIIERLRETFVEQSKNPPKFAFKLNKLVLHPEWTVSQLALVPADDATRNALEVYRKSISDAVGMEGNSSYQFHITLMYQNKQVPPEQRPEMDKMREKLEKKVAKLTQYVLCTVQVHPPRLAFFRDMTSFGDIPLYSINLSRITWKPARNKAVAEDTV